MWGRKIRRDEPRYTTSDITYSPGEPLSSGGKTYKPDPVVEDAKQRMATEMDLGRTPYNFSGELSGGGGGFSPMATFSTIALVAVIAIGFLAWKVVNGVSGKIDNLNRNMATISAQLQSGMEAQEAAGRALVRSELRKTLVSLDSAISLGDPAVTAQAMKLRDEVRGLLNSIESANINPRAAIQPQQGEVGEPAISKLSPAPQLETKAEAEVSRQPAAVVGSDTATTEKPATAGQSASPSAVVEENVKR